ncbi:hypothetical protein AVEN_159583-1 [Araneus ventricosus]|uniref:Uncharacterized protein n=1 Tax=Araneus ventricosus TaxID=182803 RepID=A0A4Y2HFW2_ARAVE|nr:hypothetical protein AVEN_159583-1 [Araneus ventricosus]
MNFTSELKLEWKKPGSRFLKQIYKYSDARFTSTVGCVNPTSGKASASGPEDSRFTPRLHRISALYAGLLLAESYAEGAKRPPTGVARKFGEGVAAQVSSSSEPARTKAGPGANIALCFLLHCTIWFSKD